jgi:hypothetical protein
MVGSKITRLHPWDLRQSGWKLAGFQCPGQGRYGSFQFFFMYWNQLHVEDDLIQAGLQ